MICSDHRLESNRQNAQKSTGPKTPEGKARSSQNALKHGLSCPRGSSLLPGEDPGAYAMFCSEVRGSFHPATPAEVLLVQRIADLLWRLRRVPDAEAAIHARHDERRRADAQQRYDRARREHDEYCARRATKKVLPPPPEPPDLTPATAADLLAHHCTVTEDKDNPFLRLQRYESSLDRALSRALKELRLLQKDRRDHPPHEGDEHAPRRNEPTVGPEATTPAPVTGDEAPATPIDELPNEPTPPPQVTRDQGPETPIEELRNEPNPPSVSTVSSVAEPVPQSQIPTNPQVERPTQRFLLNRTDLRPIPPAPDPARPASGSHSPAS